MDTQVEMQNGLARHDALRWGGLWHAGILLVGVLVLAGCSASEPDAQAVSATADAAESDEPSPAGITPGPQGDTTQEADPADEGDGDAGAQQQPHEEALFYGDFEDELLLFAGATTQEFCTDEQPTNPSTVTSGEDGSTTIEVDVAEWPLYLYASPLGAPDLIDATCEAMFDDDPTTAPQEPIATGEGRSQLRVRIDADGTTHVENTTDGTVIEADGTPLDVSGWAELDVVDGMPVGDPAEFQGLEVVEAGN